MEHVLADLNAVTDSLVVTSRLPPIPHQEIGSLSICAKLNT